MSKGNPGARFPRLGQGPALNLPGGWPPGCDSDPVLDPPRNPDVNRLLTHCGPAFRRAVCTCSHAEPAEACLLGEVADLTYSVPQSRYVFEFSLLLTLRWR